MGFRFFLALVASTVLLAAGQVAAFGNLATNGDGASQSGTVMETLESGGYTYMKLAQGDKQIWAASPKTTVTVGETVQFVEQMRMPNFTSNTLNRTFDELVFISNVNGATAAPADAPKLAAAAATASMAPTPVAKVEGGYTVAEVFAQKDQLKGQVVKVRGKVIKVSQAIMGTNWIHIQDGTGTQGTDKIIFRSPDQLAQVGSIVTAEGTVTTDQDFGFGYQYAVLVENASFTE